jgi:hypothetical protein
MVGCLKWRSYGQPRAQPFNHGSLSCSHGFLLCQNGEEDRIYRHRVFEADGGDHIGYIDFERELRTGERYMYPDGRLFRILSMRTIGPTGNCLRKLEVTETINGSMKSVRTRGELTGDIRPEKVAE